ncbi:Kef-type transport system [Natronomonas pharaonis DSM 2160]|uniref:Kef-type transport system n=1 Tax=Natronomonas pharaonis (strain ATCC 35678 / DSM 2160 / CIP 103997 / JCM 8858 / NBRC 14720 / NCIMB 2260 / Gabara) TaxID=348780 RepID=A0A1U7EXJ0_NATPD|nr:cation:proton antiporter [Natronomonas pharaonis]CAI49893.1 Kef-type transport system [Natronomonas pharaonis DSM 2160]
MTDAVLTLAAVFIAAGALSLLANHFEYPVVPAYIVAGLLAGTFIAPSDVFELAQWGIAFLVFVFGIRVDLSDIRSVLRDAEVAALTQLLVVGVVATGVGYGLSLSFGFDHPIRNAIYFAAAATFSSTVVGSGVLAAGTQNNLVYGRLASSIHFFDDIVAIGLVLVLSADALTDPQAVTSNIGYGVVLLVAGLVFYRYGFPRLVRAADGSDELVLMGSISILIAFIAAAELAGISIVVGAFAAGLAIQDEGGEALDVRNGIDSIKDFFAAIFFVTIGALVQFPTIEIVVLTAVLVALVLLVNPAVHTAAFLYEGYDARTSFFASSTLAQTSEFALIIAIHAWLLGTIAPSLFDAIILTAAITMVVATVVRRFQGQLYTSIVARLVEGQQTRQVDKHSSVDDGLEDHVVIVGHGRQGRRVVEQLETLGEDYVVVENDPAKRRGLKTDCKNHVFGDAMATYPMAKARLPEAKLLVSTVDYEPLSRSLLLRSTEADIIVRSESAVEARTLLDAGAMFVTHSNILAADRLVESIEQVIQGGQGSDTPRTEHRSRLPSRQTARGGRRTPTEGWGHQETRERQ